MLGKNVEEDGNEIYIEENGEDHETGFVENLRGIDKHTVHEDESD